MSRKERPDPTGVRRRKKQIREQPVTIPIINKEMTRRQFLKTGVATATVLVAEEGIRRLVIPKLFGKEPLQLPKDNSAFVNEIAQEMGINPNMSRVEIVEKVFWDKIIPDPDWMKGHGFENPMVLENQEPVKVIIDPIDGEPIFYNPDHKVPELNYPSQEPSVNILIRGKNNVVIYGDNQTAINIINNEGVILDFADEYFADSIAETNVLHLNFMHENQMVDFMDLGNEDLSNQEAPFKGSVSASTNKIGTITRDPETGSLVMGLSRIDVVLNLALLHTNAERRQIGITRSLIGHLVNEQYNLLETGPFTQLVNNQITALGNLDYAEFRFSQLNKEYSNEAPSSMADLLALNDNAWAEVFLGRNYRKFVDLLFMEMERYSDNGTERQLGSELPEVTKHYLELEENEAAKQGITFRFTRQSEQEVFSFIY